MKRNNAFYGYDQSPWAPSDNHIPVDTQSCPPELTSSQFPMSESEDSYDGPLWGSCDEGPFDAPCDPIDDLIESSQD